MELAVLYDDATVLSRQRVHSGETLLGINWQLMPQTRTRQKPQKACHFTA
jgi:hypothetical protein